MMLDFVATRYHILPSKLLSDGSSIDYLIAQYAQDYQSHINQQQEARGTSKVPSDLKMAPKLSQDTMQAMMERARNGQG
jgi:hypothetical protein